MSGVISTTLVSKNALTSPSLMRFSMSGLIQYFTFGVIPGPAVDQCDARAAAPQLERCYGSGVLAADHRDVHLEIGVGIDVIVVNLAEVSPGIPM